MRDSRRLSRVQDRLKRLEERSMRMLRRILLPVLFAVLPAIASAQAIDDRLDRLRANPTASRAFALDIQPEAPVVVVMVEELRQPNPPHRYAVTLQNRSQAAVATITAVACVVASDGSVKSVDRLAVVKNLKPGQSRRLETAPRSAVVSISDRVAFVIQSAEDGQGGVWTLTNQELAERIKQAAPTP